MGKSRKKSIRRRHGGDREAVLQRILRLIPSLPSLGSSISTSLDIQDRNSEAFDRWFGFGAEQAGNIIYNDGHVSREDLALLTLEDKKTILLSAMQQHGYPHLVPIFAAITPVPRSTQDSDDANSAWYRRIMDRLFRNLAQDGRHAAAAQPAAAVRSNAWRPPNRSMSNIRHVVDCKPLIDQLKDLLMDPISQSVIQDPVIAEDGHLYDRQGIEGWFREHDTSPLTRQKISKRLLPFVELRSVITYVKPYLEHLEEMSGGKLSKMSKKSGKKRRSAGSREQFRDDRHI